MHRIQVHPNAASFFLALATLVISCGQGNGPTARSIPVPGAALSSASYTVGGTISGLSGSAVLQDNGGDDLTVSTSGSFTFNTALANGSSYAVTVLTPPPGQVCDVMNNGTGTISGANVTNVWVSCAAAFTVGGTITGLAGTVVLQDNGGDDLTLSNDGSFTFATPIRNYYGYAVGVLTQPAGQICGVSNGFGSIPNSNVTDVAVICAATSSTYTVGGTISGISGDSVMVRNNDGDDLTLSVDGPFRFSTPLANGSSYEVALATQPADASRACYVYAGEGTIASIDVTNVSVYCMTLQGGIGWGCVADSAGNLTGWCAGDDGACGGGPSQQCVGRETLPIHPAVCMPSDSTWCMY
jgi:hypothetical protein